MKYGCIGENLTHSFSKEIHETFTNHYQYEIKEVSKENFNLFMKNRLFCGINITIPYKQLAIPYLDEINEDAKNIGAVNTIVNRNGKLWGYNTDFFGMVELIKYHKINLKNKKVLILGTGGTSKTAAAVANHLGASQIVFVSRNKSAKSVTYDQAYKLHNDAQIIINTTPCGMFPNIENVPIDLSNFSNLSGLIDAIYNPLRSKLVINAKNSGILAAGGLYMLVAQAAKSIEKFLNCNITTQKIKNVYNDILKQKENIVLIGMPGCGKSTIGNSLSKQLKRNFIDIDVEIEKKEKKPIHKIIEHDGIDKFRQIETEIIRSIAPLNGSIISTGGGCILKQENINLLKHNGKLLFIDCPLELLTPTKDRPLSSTSTKLRQLYENRHELYIKNADKIIATDKNLLHNIEKIKMAIN